MWRAALFAAAAAPSAPQNGGDSSSLLATLALAVSGFSALVALATYLSTREIRSLDRSIKRLELVKSNQSRQAERVEAAEESFESLVTQLWSVFTDVQQLADLRERAAVDTTRPLTLPRASFDLQPHLHADYANVLRRLGAGVARLSSGVETTLESLGGVRDDVWSITTLDVARDVRHMRKACARLVNDPDLRLSEASGIVSAEYARAQDVLAFIRGDATPAVPPGTT